MWGSVLLHFHVHRAVADFKYLEKLPTLYFILNTVKKESSVLILAVVHLFWKSET